MENALFGSSASFLIADHCVFNSCKRCLLQVSKFQLSKLRLSIVSSSFKPGSGSGGTSKSRRLITARPVVAQPEAATVPAQNDLRDVAAGLEGFYALKSTRITPSDDLKDAAAALEDVYNQQSMPSSRKVPRILESKRGKRLSLRKRIILKQFRLESRSETNDLWSEESDQLIRESYDLKPFDWHALDYPILSRQEELHLVQLMKPMKELLKFKAELRTATCREPTDEEWAEASSWDLKTLQRHLQLGNAAQTKLIKHNSRLVLFLAKKYQHEAGSFALEDLCQQGVGALIDALERFRPDKGARFSTYALYWVRTAMLRAISQNGYLVRVPPSYTIKRLEIRKAARELRMELGKQPTHEQIMERVGLDPEKYWRVREKLQVRSLDAPVRGTNETLLEYLPDEEDDTLEILEDLELLMASKLKPKERQVLRHRYFVAGTQRRSLREVGLQMNLSPEMVRRYEASALKKLKQSRPRNATKK